jgi:hypothetical protein
VFLPFQTRGAKNTNCGHTKLPDPWLDTSPSLGIVILAMQQDNASNKHAYSLVIQPSHRCHGLLCGDHIGALHQNKSSVKRNIVAIQRNWIQYKHIKEYTAVLLSRPSGNN